MRKSVTSKNIFNNLLTFIRIISHHLSTNPVSAYILNTLIGYWMHCVRDRTVSCVSFWLDILFYGFLVPKIIPTSVMFLYILLNILPMFSLFIGRATDALNNDIAVILSIGLPTVMLLKMLVLKYFPFHWLSYFLINGSCWVYIIITTALLLLPTNGAERLYQKFRKMN